MAGGGVGEAALIGAALGGTASAVQGGDPLKGAMLGGLTGGAGAGLMGAAGAGAASAGGAGAFTGATPTGLATIAGEGAASSPGILGALGSMSTPAKLAMGATGIGLLGAMGDRGDDMPGTEKYSGPLSRFQYDPNTYTPYTYKPYAAGGPVEAMSAANVYAMQNARGGVTDMGFDNSTGMEMMADGGLAALAGGGISDLGDYSDGGRLLKGPGDGVSDSIPAMISNRRPARLADNEFVIPARIVSEIGNGSTDAGARELYKMMDRVQARRAKTVGKGKVAVDSGARQEVEKL